MRRVSVVYAFALIGVLTLTGCPPKKKLVVAEKTPEAEPTPEAVSNDIVIGKEWREIPGLETVRFDFDSAALREDAKVILKKNVAILKKLPNKVIIRVEGHCDDRGTVEYNLALGQRRANAVSSFYRTAGIDKARLKTISYGEERPLCSWQTEDCWAQNRRGVTTVMSESPITVSPDKLR